MGAPTPTEARWIDVTINRRGCSYVPGIGTHEHHPVLRSMPHRDRVVQSRVGLIIPIRERRAMYGGGLSYDRSLRTAITDESKLHRTGHEIKVTSPKEEQRAPAEEKNDPELMPKAT